MPSSHTYTIVVPEKDEDHRILDQLVSETQTRFQGRVTLSIVDDGSRNPYPGAVHRHESSLGYGRALKSGISLATSEWVVTMDGDGQHRLRDVERLIEFTQDFPSVDMVVGDRRIRDRGVRYFGRKALNWAASLFAWRYIPDLNSGLRIIRRRVAQGYLPILCDGFSFTTSITTAMLADGYKVDWLPIQVNPRPFGKSHVRLLRDGLVTLRYIVWIGLALRTRRIRRVWRSLYGRP